jgi:LAO/AO transport system kinase
METLADKILAGDEVSAARLMRAIDDDLPAATEELRKLYKHTGNAFIIGITGSPGVGKSTLVDALITGFRERKMTVGVVAVDPTSPFTGGALLGDRVRMGNHATDKGVFIRSLASRGWSGGLSRATTSVIHVLDAMKKDIVLVEAVGSRVSDTTIVVLSPGAGDEIQMMKAGILETADIYVVNKADKEGAENLRVQLESMSAMKDRKSEDWNPLILMTQAYTGKGVDEVINALLQHRDFMLKNGDILKRHLQQARLELKDAAEYALRKRITSVLESAYIEQLANDLVEKKVDPYAAADEVMSKALNARKTRKTA